MKDIRAIAEARAKQRAEGNTSDSQSSFQSERARAKEALRREVNAYSGDDVHKISAMTQTAGDDRILRVAAYCRVSTDDIDQLMSIELQKKHYREMITANPKWKYVGTYVDDGFSGRNTRRPAYRQMMSDIDSWDSILVLKMDRIHRNTRNFIEMMEISKSKAVQYALSTCSWAANE